MSEQTTPILDPRVIANLQPSVQDYIKRLAADLDQTRVQLTGCGVAAQGSTSAPHRVHPGDFGWSASYGEVLRLRLRFDARMEELYETRAALKVERGRRVILEISSEITDELPEDVEDAFNLLDERLREMAEERQSRADDRRERAEMLTEASLSEIANDGVPTVYATINLTDTEPDSPPPAAV